MFPLTDSLKLMERWSTHDVYASQKATEEKLYDMYIAAQQNFAWLLNHGIWKMAGHSKG